MIFETVYVILLFFSAYFIIFHLNLWFDNKNRFFLKGSLKTLPSVSLIIPAYNEEDIIEETQEKAYRYYRRRVSDKGSRYQITADAVVLITQGRPVFEESLEPAD